MVGARKRIPNLDVTAFEFFGKGRERTTDVAARQCAFELGDRLLVEYWKLAGFPVRHLRIRGGAIHANGECTRRALAGLRTGSHFVGDCHGSGESEFNVTLPVVDGFTQRDEFTRVAQEYRDEFRIEMRARFLLDHLQGLLIR